MCKKCFDAYISSGDAKLTFIKNEWKICNVKIEGSIPDWVSKEMWFMLLFSDMLYQYARAMARTCEMEQDEALDILRDFVGWGDDDEDEDDEDPKQVVGEIIGKIIEHIKSKKN